MQRSCFRYFGLSKKMGWNFSSSWKLPTTSSTKLRVINFISFSLRNYPCHLTLILSSFKLLTWSSTNQGLLHKLIVVAHWFIIHWKTFSNPTATRGESPSTRRILRTFRRSNSYHRHTKLCFWYHSLASQPSTSSPTPIPTHPTSRPPDSVSLCRQALGFHSLLHHGPIAAYPHRATPLPSPARASKPVTSLAAPPCLPTGAGAPPPPHHLTSPHRCHLSP
jgi:hypothetical protein